MSHPFITRFALATALGAGTLGQALAQPAAVNLDQGWTAEQKTWWYSATQGSRLVPYAFLMALEQATSATPFLDPQHIASLNYLPDGVGGLPVGFSVNKSDPKNRNVTAFSWDQDTNPPWVGFNCSACHTAELRYKGQAIRVEGGPTLADFNQFMTALRDAMAATRDDAAKFDRFARNVLKAQDTPANRTALKTALQTVIDQRSNELAMNKAAVEYGPGRLDAFGHIFNRVSLFAKPDKPMTHPASAPVSYPFLWNVPQQNKVQWNGIAPKKEINNFDVGALARNSGEVLGVHGDFVISPGSGLRLFPKAYRSTLDLKNIAGFEKLLTQLRPPAWPEATLGKTDPQKVAAGEKLFEQRCISCHSTGGFNSKGELKRTDLTTPVTVTMSLFTPTKDNPSPPPGTDPWMACNAYTYRALTGNLQGAPSGLLARLARLDRLGPKAGGADMLGITVTGVLLADGTDVIGEIIRGNRGEWSEREAAPLVGALGNSFGKGASTDVVEAAQGSGAMPMAVSTAPPRSRYDQARLNKCLKDQAPILGYKGRPLTGIWATGPYLHNGSVPTLYDLLLPPAQRPGSFYTGTREFDPVKVGYQTAASAENRFLFRAVDDQKRQIDGNGNEGHDYDNAGLTETQRMELIEYMKTL